MHGQFRKNISALGHIADAEMGNFVRLHTENIFATPQHLAAIVNHAHDRLNRGGSPRSVASKQRHNFTLVHMQIHALQDVAFAVERVQLFHFERDFIGAHTVAPSASSTAPKYASFTFGSARTFSGVSNAITSP